VSLFAELKRRNVFRVAVAYSIVAWVLAQVADLAFDNFGSPEWVSKSVLFILVLGLPLAIFFAWAFELTPDGIKKEKDVDRDQSITPTTGRKLDILIIAVLVVAVGFLLSDKFQHGDLQPADDATSDRFRMSIAVLPFENRSNRPEDEYFTDGIHDDLLTTIANIGSMKVISRTSVMEYKSTIKKIPEIARELGVANILEGGIQRSGDNVRINVQLIDARTDEHLWAEIYDRELTAENLFAIQSEVSTAIAKALNATLSPEEKQRVSSVPTQNLEAYEAYLLGRQKWAARTAESTAEAVTLFQKAIALDQGYAQAYAGLADAYRHQVPYGGLPQSEVFPKAEIAVRKALELDDTLGEAYATLGGLLSQQYDNVAARAALEHALDLNPNYAVAYNWLAIIYTASGEFEQSLDIARRGLEIDPRSLILQFNIAGYLGILGRPEEMKAGYERILEIAPESPMGYLGQAYFAAYGGRVSDAILWLNRTVGRDETEPANFAYIASLYLDLDDSRAAQYWIEQAANIRSDNYTVHVARALEALHEGDALATRSFAERAADDATEALFTPIVLFELLQRDVEDNSPHRLIKKLQLVAPELSDTGGAGVNRANSILALGIAALHQRQGNATEAQQLLDSTIRVLESLDKKSTLRSPDLAIAYALAGDNAKAMSALRALVDAGWRISWWYYFDHLALLEPLRDDPAFGALRAEVAADMARQRESVRKLEASGEVRSPATIPAARTPPPT
jgi:TolB-like protein